MWRAGWGAGPAKSTFLPIRERGDCQILPNTAKHCHLLPKAASRPQEADNQCMASGQRGPLSRRSGVLHALLQEGGPVVEGHGWKREKTVDANL